MLSHECAHPCFALQGDMADSSELFIFGDDFDTILDMLKEEKEMDGYFTEAADDASITTILIM